MPSVPCEATGLLVDGKDLYLHTQIDDGKVMQEYRVDWSGRLVATANVSRGDASIYPRPRPGRSIFGPSKGVALVLGSDARGFRYESFTILSGCPINECQQFRRIRQVDDQVVAIDPRPLAQERDEYVTPGGGLYQLRWDRDPGPTRIEIVQLLAPLPSTSAAPVPSQGGTVPTPAPSTVAAIPGSITGRVFWNHHPQAGIRVEISELGAPNHGPALATGTTNADGSFTVPYSGPASSIGAFVPAHGPYLEGGRAVPGAGPFVADPIDLRRAVTGLSVHDRDVFAPGPVNITWDAVPEAASYGVSVWLVSTGAAGPSTCPAFSPLPGALVTTPGYTTPVLAPGLYAIGVAALTDVVIGELPPTGVAFRIE